ncbi:unnamed protein product [Orchesella dallaii]|uniref:Galectin n=1 Tax=Orchesella dallaii TaxID=48710 RepID=A0ABP1S8G6_9HEXA
MICGYLLGVLVMSTSPSLSLPDMNVPFVTELGSRLKVGDKITIAGTILPTASSFTINLRNNHQQEGNTILLHFNVRFFSPNYVVLNTHISGFGWLNEERKTAPFSLRKGYPFQIDILCEEEEFLVSVDGQPFHEYKYRLPLEGANVLEISGGDRLEVKINNNRGGASEIFKGSNSDATTIYRQIEILVHSFNRAHSGQLVMILLALLTITVICSLSVIKALTSGTFTDPRSFYANCFFAYSVMNSIILLLMVYGLCGNLHQDASRCVAEMRRTALTCEPRQRKLLQRTVMALPVLKIEFGGTNFVEKRTPFVYLEFALGRIIDGLLLSKPK